jgi:hypothetical protein
MASDLSKHLSGDSAMRGRQVFALTLHLLQRGADPAALETLWTNLGAKNAQKLVDDARKTIQFKRTRQFLGAVSAECIAVAAAELGVSVGRSFTLHVGEDIRAIPIPKAIVAGRFSRNSLAFVMGEPGVGKTFWMVSLAASITTGQQTWMGNSIHPDLRGGTVIYALAEGAGMFQVRLVGALQHLQRSAAVEIPKSFVFTKESLKLEDTATIERFIAEAEPHRPCMVVVDTYQRHGGPETEEERVNKAIEHLTLIKEELECTVVGVHHLPKDGRQTPRGHGAIDGSIDTAVYLTKDEKGVLAARFEQRDLEESTFYAQTKIQIVDGYIDDDTGNPKTTLVLEESKMTKRAVQTSRKQDQLTLAIVAAVDLTPGVSQSELCKAVGGKKTVAMAEIRRMVGAGELLMDSQPAVGGKIKNTFTLPRSVI